VVVMNHGRIEQAGPPREVFNRPGSAFVARFMGGHNVIAAPGGAVAVRADRLRLLPAGSAAASGMAGTISEIEYHGSFVRVAVTAAGGAELTAEIEDAAFDAAPHSVGAPVFAAWDPAEAHPVG